MKVKLLNISNERKPKALITRKHPLKEFLKEVIRKEMVSEGNLELQG